MIAVEQLKALMEGVADQLDLRYSRECGRVEELSFGIRQNHPDQRIFAGDWMADSYQWDDGEILLDEPLDGCCTIGLWSWGESDRDEEELDQKVVSRFAKAIKLMDDYRFGGSLCLVAGRNASSGRDEGEWILKDPICVATWEPARDRMTAWGTAADPVAVRLSLEPTSSIPVLYGAEKTQLEALATSTNKLVRRRAQVILGLADGLTRAELARDLVMTKRTIAAILSRFAERGVASVAQPCSRSVGDKAPLAMAA
jgi:hypothetical protein